MTKRPLYLACVGDITLLQKPGENLLLSKWESADIRIGNLEAPIIKDFGAPADKQLRLQQPVEAAKWLKELDVTAVSLANNHTLDWGLQGLDQTIKELNNVGIKHAGAGKNINEAIKAVYFDVDEYKIAFISWSSTLPPGFQALSNRPGIAGIRVKTSYEIDPGVEYEQPGTPPWISTKPNEEDLILLENALIEANQNADFVIFAIHWGVPPQWCTPYQGLIAEYQPIIAKCAVKAGADIIIGHHSHAPYGMETFTEKFHGKRKTVPVLYSLGNYIVHYEHLPSGIDTSSFTLPHYPPSLPENRQSCITSIKLQHQNGRLEVEELTIIPAILNKVGEAVEINLEEKLLITNRLKEFSNLRGTKTFIKEANLVWRS